MSPLVVLLLASLGRVAANSLCPDKCNCDDVHLTVTCIRSGLDVMPNTLNPGLQTIEYQYNNFPTIDVSIRFLPSLKKVYLSHNRIVSVPDRTFEVQTDLTELRLDNNKISVITNRTFFGLKNLEFLSLHANLIGGLTNGLFVQTPALRELDLSRNRISEIAVNAFQGLNSLRLLNLADNLLTSLPTEAFSLIPDLAELSLAGNTFRVLPSNAFQPFNALTSLDISSCQIGDISRQAFVGLGTLRTLKLSHNNLTEVPSHSFEPLGRVEELSVGQNPMMIVRTDAFSNLPALRGVDISGCNQLRQINPSAFRGCSNLERVEIRSNRVLEAIADEAFDPSATRLRHLDLADNGLDSIGERLIDWERLKFLDLSGNPWKCTCDLIFVSAALARLENGSDASRCTAPASMSGRPLASLGPDALLCGASLRNVQTDSSNETAVIVSVVVVSVVCACAILAFVLVKCKCKEKAIRWRKHEDTMKQEYEYQKTFGHDDDYFIQIANARDMSSARPIPVTEL